LLDVISRGLTLAKQSFADSVPKQSLGTRVRTDSFVKPFVAKAATWIVPGNRVLGTAPVIGTTNTIGINPNAASSLKMTAGRVPDCS